VNAFIAIQIEELFRNRKTVAVVGKK